MNSQSLHKYVQLKEFIKQYIINGELKPDDQIYSENELANKFKISRHTVRQAIGELVNEGWLYRIQGKGTFVVSLGRQMKESTKTVGVVTTYLSDYIFPNIIKGIDNVLSANGYSIVLGYTNNKVERESACLENMMQRDLDGMIVEPTKSALPNPNVEIYKELKHKGMPLIFINGYYSGLDSPFVVEDDEVGGYMAAKHLIDMGHKQIGGIFKFDDVQGHGRYKGFVRAHREKGLPIREHAITWFSTEDVDIIFNPQYDQLFLNRLKDSTALVCYNDQISLKVLDILRRNNIKVPECLSLVSFDDSDLAEATEVKLTTVAHPHDRLGEKAAKMLLDIINKGYKKGFQEIICPELVVRNSTKKV